MEIEYISLPKLKREIRRSDLTGDQVFLCCMPRPATYDFSSCFFPKLKIMHFQNRDIKLYTVVLLFLCFLKFLLKLCCR